MSQQWRGVYLVCVQNVTIANADLDSVCQEFVCELLDLTGPCGGEKKILTLFRDMADDLSDLKGSRRRRLAIFTYWRIVIHACP